MADDQATERDLDAYKQLLTLWAQENPIKTTKLQVLMAVNGGLLSVVQLRGGFTEDNWTLYAAGAVLSLVWTFSIGRTVLYQKLWQSKIQAIAAKHPGDPRFQITDVEEVRAGVSTWLRAVGGVSSGYYLLGAPIVFCLFWLAAVAIIRQ